MRSTSDRVRHALSFEVIGLMIVTPLGAWAFHLPTSQIGVVALIGATIATLWNYAYNLGFDHMMWRFYGRTSKTLKLRVVHAFAFEAGLLVWVLPLFAWYLGVGLFQAFLMDVSFALFYLVYAFVFNWAYDKIFPLPEWNQAAEGSI
ncbi:PACE efflux transporter [Aurantimonas sp. E1-2-R+4]|uniref:PACE efflux transporter n=1 Tax=Aurantimonas sp. E1-2-R+4 TaxID=3113714 RepID=UPI002F930275